jgi:hypothetical protein
MSSSAIIEIPPMNISLRLYNGTVHIPTSYFNGFFVENAPVASVPVEQTEGLQQAILAAIERGNPPISRDQARVLIHGKGSPVLKATGARSWYVLDRQTSGLWSLVEKDGVYQIRVDQPMEPRGWHEDKTKRVEFPPGTSVEDVINRLIAMIQERAQQ